MWSEIALEMLRIRCIFSLRCLFLASSAPALPPGHRILIGTSHIGACSHQR
jgi:hypothetical protein